jgi:hypothetical protein
MYEVDLKAKNRFVCRISDYSTSIAKSSGTDGLDQSAVSSGRRKTLTMISLAPLSNA